MTIAAAQCAARPGDIAANLARHLAFAEMAALRGVSLLVFPELSLTGYELELGPSCVLNPAAAVLHPLRQCAAQAGMTIVVGAPVQLLTGLHIGAIALRPDGSHILYTKQHVHVSEEHVFTSGPGGPLVDQTALAICRDATFPSHAATAARRGAKIYAAGAFITADAIERKSGLLRDYAARHRMTTLLANYAGNTGGETSAGQSAIWAPNGEVIAACPDNREALVIARGDGTGEVLFVR